MRSTNQIHNGFYDTTGATYRWQSGWIQGSSVNMVVREDGDIRTGFTYTVSICVPSLYFPDTWTSYTIHSITVENIVGQSFSVSNFTKSESIITGTFNRAVTVGRVFPKVNIDITYTGTVRTSEKWDSVLLDEESFKIYDDETDWDMIANEAITNISSMTATYYDNSSSLAVREKAGGAMEVVFTPIEDTKLLDAIDKGYTTIRLQLLQHLCGGTASYACSRPIYISTGSYCDVNHFYRVRSHDPKYYGITWLNLTSTDLINGYVSLYGMQFGLDSWTHARFDKSLAGDGETIRYQFISAELYVPALGKGHSDTFQYERLGYCRVADNYTLYKTNKKPHTKVMK